MIKINLLPVKHDRRKEAGRNQLLIGTLVLVLELVIAIFLSMAVEDDIAKQKNVNDSVNAQISRLSKTIEGHKQILNEIAEFEKRQQAIDELQAARTGPVHVMLELSRILSKNGHPTIDDEYYQNIIKKNPSRGYDENWDFRKVWISSFSENSKHVKITGQGVSHEDVAEFLRRINLSSFFVSSELISTHLSKPNIKVDGDDKEKIGDVVNFILIGDVRYR
ncbi:MAG: PilN domain-containing protein [Deltaproteobacteria bacterium]|nr:PilN domain-containing protein [Deltaproteobacteria bacterium]